MQAAEGVGSKGETAISSAPLSVLPGLAPERSLDGVNHPDFYGNLKAAGSGGDYEICGHCTILHYSTMAL